MKLFFVGLFVGSFVTYAAAIQLNSIGNYTGETWQKFDSTFKIGYLGGYLDSQGIHRVQLTRCKNMALNLEQCAEDLEKRFPALNRDAAEQALKGIDKLSGDYRNGKVNIVGLINVASMELAGRPKDEVDAALRSWREAANR